MMFFVVVNKDYWSSLRLQENIENFLRTLFLEPRSRSINLLKRSDFLTYSMDISYSKITKILFSLKNYEK